MVEAFNDRRTCDGHTKVFTVERGHRSCDGPHRAVFELNRMLDVEVACSYSFRCTERSCGDHEIRSVFNVYT